MAPVRSESCKTTSLTDLPPELLEHIARSLNSAKSIAHLGRTNRTLHSFVEKNAWQTFTRKCFPSFQSTEVYSDHKHLARTLTAVSRAWDRRALVARNFEPQGDIRALPDGKKIEQWKRPRGQSIGFAPQIDCYETFGPTSCDLSEVVAFSAGAEICIRKKVTTHKRRGEELKWSTYRPKSAVEGRDDITSLHLWRPSNALEEEAGQQLITGTANGDLQLLHVLRDRSECLTQTYFVTQGQPVHSSGISQPADGGTLLAANLGDHSVSLYRVIPGEQKAAPISSVDIKPPANTVRAYRAWSTTFLSPSELAIGLGPSDEPIHIYDVSPTGLSAEPLRKLGLQNDKERLDTDGTPLGRTHRITSSVYPIIPLPPSTHGTAGGSVEGQVFLSGAYDGVVRLHDLRSASSVAQSYFDPIDDSTIYSLLARGQEKFVAGASRHSLLKVFDLRLGAKAYSYLNADGSNASTPTSTPSPNWSLFVKPHSATYPGRGGGNNWARRSAESSIYSLASSSSHSAVIYVGVENAALEIAFTGIADRHAEPVLFDPCLRDQDRSDAEKSVQKLSRDVANLAMHDHSNDFRLCTQRTLTETWRQFGPAAERASGQRHGKRNKDERKVSALPGLDERWQVTS